MLSTTALTQNTILGWQHRRLMDKKRLIQISAVMIIGMPFGMIGFAYLSESIMKLLLAGLVIVISAKNLYQAIKKKWDKVKDEPKEKALSNWNYLYVIGSGFFNGAFACGGPLMVIYCTKFFKDINVFSQTGHHYWPLLSAS